MQAAEGIFEGKFDDVKDDDDDDDDDVLEMMTLTQESKKVDKTVCVPYSFICRFGTWIVLNYWV